MRATFSVEGLRELDAALGELPKATARNVLKRVLTKAAEPIAADARNLAPVDSGQLRDSIAISARVKNKAGSSEFAAVLRGGGTKADAVKAMRDARRAAGGGSFAEVHVGPDVKAPHAHWQEFGTGHHDMQPFMRPAWERNKNGLMPSIRSDLWSEIERAARRLARRKARAAAKAAAGGS
jgi:HK97 gp10 family phage protein